jgi:hypothetical protein
MRWIIRSTFVIALTCGTQLLCVAQDSRAVDFNTGWKFFKGDGQGFEKAAFDDSGWRTLTLPHDWSVEEPFSEAWASGTGYLPGGIGWYRKKFSLPADHGSKNIYIYFDGVYKNSEIWINDQYLGKRPNGYSSFYHDITPYLKKRGGNVIVVKADHTDFADSRWYTGSGINRNVYLIATASVHVDVWGMTFTTPRVSVEKADAVVTVSLRNTSPKDAAVQVITELLTADGRVVSKTESDVKVNPNQRTSTTLNLQLEKPALWSPDHPNLYTLRTTLLVDGKSVDQVSEQVGFRFFAFDKNTGFSLNGVGMKIKGVCIHDDAGAFGSAVPAAVWERRLKILKSTGCNAIRMSHNPHQDYLYALCDKLGLMVQDEAFDEWELGKNKWIKGWNVGTPGKDGYNKDFNAWAERDLADMILRNKNRACIIMWSIGNEIDYPNDPYTHEILNTGRNPQIYGRGYQPGYPPAGRLGEIAARLTAIVRRVDPTRPVTAALAGVVMSNETTYPDLLDVVGYNYQEYRYRDDHAKYPDRIIYGSENGQSPEAWQAVEENAFISAQFLWTGIDFLGEARAWPVRSSGAGLLELTGFPKPQYYVRKLLWNSDPAIVLSTSANRRSPATSSWNWYEGDSVTVRCVANTEEVELFLNGVSLGKNTPQNKTANWRIVFQPGELLAKGYNNGREVTQQKLVTAGEAKAIQATSDRLNLSIHRDSIAHVAIRLVDKHGIIAPQADDEIEVVVTGPGEVVAMESGDLSSHESYRAPKRKAYRGAALAYIRARGKGRITIEIKVKDLQPVSIQITGK